MAPSVDTTSSNASSIAVTATIAGRSRARAHEPNGASPLRRIGRSTRKYDAVAIAPVTAMRSAKSANPLSPVRASSSNTSIGQCQR